MKTFEITTEEEPRRGYCCRVIVDQEQHSVAQVQIRWYRCQWVAEANSPIDLAIARIQVHLHVCMLEEASTPLQGLNVNRRREGAIHVLEQSD